MDYNNEEHVALRFILGETMRTENVELTVACLIHRNDEYLLQNHIKGSWTGFTFPGGHVEKDESIVEAVKREIREETGLTLLHPRLCGVKQFPIENGRYLVFLFESEEFEGELKSSEEGPMYWVKKEDLSSLNLVGGFMEQLEVMLSDDLNEFIQVEKDGKWLNISL